MNTRQVTADENGTILSTESSGHTGSQDHVLSKIYLIITPETVTLDNYGIQKFTVKTSEGDTAAVDWITTEGRITKDGIFIAPGASGKVIIQAVDKTHPERTGRAEVTIVPGSSSPIDLVINAVDITLSTTIPHDGDTVYAKARVRNRTGAAVKTIASSVRFTMNGTSVGTYPFIISKGSSYTDVSARIDIPEGPYTGMMANTTTPLHIGAEADPENTRTEPNESDNFAERAFPVKAGSRITSDTTPGDMVINPEGITVFSYRSDSSTNRILATIPGRKLFINTTFQHKSAKKTIKPHIQVYMDNVLMKDHVYSFTKTSAGTAKLSFEWFTIPEKTGFTTIRVVVDGESSAEITVPVVPWSLGLSSGDIRWTSTSDYPTSGKPIYFHTDVRNPGGFGYTNSYNKVAVWFILDGKLLEEVWFTPDTAPMEMITSSMTIPTGWTSPYNLTVLVDPYKQTPDVDLNDNLASVTIPFSSNLSMINSFGLSISDLSWSPELLLPGETLNLSATVHNLSGAKLNKALPVLFKINGVTIHTTSIASGLLRPGQTQTVTKTWKIPAGLTVNPVFSVVLDPNKVITGDPRQNNTVSVSIPVPWSDLSLSADDLRLETISGATSTGSLPPNPFPTAGKTAYLKAWVHNQGFSAAIGTKTTFMFLGKPVGTVTSTIPAGGSKLVQLSYTLPAGSALPKAESEILSAVSGSMPPKTGAQTSISFGASVASGQPVNDKSPNTPNQAGWEYNISNQKAEQISPVILEATTGQILVHAYENNTVRTLPDGGQTALDLEDATVRLTSGSNSVQAMTDSFGKVTFQGVPFGAYTITVEKAGYSSVTSSHSLASGSLNQGNAIPLSPLSELTGILTNDSDFDMLTDPDELLYRTDPDNPDTDGDGVVDGKDVSPLIDPTESTWESIQQPGMIRIDQPIRFMGLDGWVDTSTLISSNERYETDGTKGSKMDAAHYKAALNRLYEPDGFTVWGVWDKTPEDFATEDVELIHDYTPEDTYLYDSTALHPRKFNFQYDYLSDYSLVSLKNTDAMKFPNETTFFSYWLQPLGITVNKEQTLTIQFRSPKTWNDMYKTDGNHYKIPSLMVDFYKTNDFNDDSNEVFNQQTLVLREVSTDTFEVVIRIPAHMAFAPMIWMKLTPVWNSKNSVSIQEPMSLADMDITGLVREVVISNDGHGNAQMLSEECSSVSDLSGPAPTSVSVTSKAGSSQYKSGINSYKLAVSTPSDDKDFAFSDVSKNVATVYDSTNKRFLTLTAHTASNLQQVNSLSELASGHWARAPAYEAAVGALMTIRDTSACLTAIGEEAWLAVQNADAATITYYSAKTTIAAGGKLVSVASKILKMTGKLEMARKLGSTKIAVGVAVAAGVVEVGYDIYKATQANDPIERSYYSEKAVADMYNTALSVAAIFSPHVVAVQITWQVEMMVYKHFFGDDFASKVASSPGSAAVFLARYFITGGIPSQMAEAAYLDIRDGLLEEIELFNSVPVGYYSLFIDPDLD